MRLSLAIISEGERMFFLRNIYTIMRKQVDTGSFIALLCIIILPLSGEASIVLAPWIKENDSKSPSDKENGKAVHAVSSCNRLCYGRWGYSKEKARKRKHTRKGEATKRKRNSCQCDFRLWSVLLKKKMDCVADGISYPFTLIDLPSILPNKATDTVTNPNNNAARPAGT